MRSCLFECLFKEMSCASSSFSVAVLLFSQCDVVRRRFILSLGKSLLVLRIVTHTVCIITPKISVSAFIDEPIEICTH